MNLGIQGLSVSSNFVFISLTPDDLENEVATLKHQYDVSLKLLMCEFSKPRPDGFPRILSARSISNSHISVDAHVTSSSVP